MPGWYVGSKYFSIRKIRKRSSILGEGIFVRVNWFRGAVESKSRNSCRDTSLRVYSWVGESDAYWEGRLFLRSVSLKSHDLLRQEKRFRPLFSRVAMLKVVPNNAADWVAFLARKKGPTRPVLIRKRWHRYSTQASLVRWLNLETSRARGDFKVRLLIGL